MEGLAEPVLEPCAAARSHVISSRAITELEAGPRTREAVDAFFGSHSFPVVDGSVITFVWRGDAEAVHLKHWVFGLPSSQQLTRVEGTDVWHRTLQLPPGSRVEYKLEVVRNGHGEWIKDPLNPNHARDPFGANSVAHGTGYEIPSWIHHDATRSGSTRRRLAAAGSGSMSRPGSSATASTRCSSSTTATTTCATRRWATSSTT
jgi:hypothetical protein